MEILERVLPAIEEKYCGEEGIYRLPGDQGRMEALLERVFYREPIDFEQELKKSVYTVCSLVKLLFRAPAECGESVGCPEQLANSLRILVQLKNAKDERYKEQLN